MNSKIALKSVLLAASLAASTMSASARADNLFVVDSGTLELYSTAGATINASVATGVGSIAASGDSLYAAVSGGIAQYDASGALVNPSLVSGLASVYAITVSGGDIFALNGAGSIAEYTTSGALVDASLVTGLSPSDVGGIAVSGGDLLVENFLVGEGLGSTISEYDATSGALLNGSFIAVNGPYAIAASGGNLFVAYNAGFTIGEYTAAGASVNASLVTAYPSDQLSIARGIAFSGNDMFVANAAFGGGGPSPNFVGEFDATTGATISSSLIPGLSGPTGVAVVPTPEPSTLILLAIGASALLANGLRGRRTRA
jgi:hypothetical protein